MIQQPCSEMAYWCVVGHVGPRDSPLDRASLEISLLGPRHESRQNPSRTQLIMNYAPLSMKSKGHAGVGSGNACTHLSPVQEPLFAQNAGPNGNAKLQ